MSPKLFEVKKRGEKKDLKDYSVQNNSINNPWVHQKHPPLKKWENQFRLSLRLHPAGLEVEPFDNDKPFFSECMAVWQFPLNHFPKYIMVEMVHGSNLKQP